MDISIFKDKTKIPSYIDLVAALEDSHYLWQEIREYTVQKYPDALQDWNYPGKKYGWSFRIKDKKRAIIYLLPREGHFKVAFVFGNKAVEKILSSTISENLKTELQNAKQFAEGRGIRIEVKDQSNIKDIKQLIEIKLEF
jgi:hypothetical protein